jgi:hypothetical protein
MGSKIFCTLCRAASPLILKIIEPVPKLRNCTKIKCTTFYFNCLRNTEITGQNNHVISVQILIDSALKRMVLGQAQAWLRQFFQAFRLASLRNLRPLPQNRSLGKAPIL